MFIVPNHTIKRMRDAEAGELVAVNLRSHRALAIILSRDPVNSLLGLIWSSEASIEKPPPFTYVIDERYGGNKDCVSYGTDWVLEVQPGPESVPGNKSVWSSPGVVQLTQDGSTIYFPSQDGGWTDGMTFNLTKSQLTESSDVGVPHLNWKIWRSLEDQMRKSGEALVTFAGKDQQRP